MGIAVKLEQSTFSTYPEKIIPDIHPGNPVMKFPDAFLSFIIIVSGQFVSIIALKSSVGTQPHEPCIILHQTGDIRMGQSVLNRQMMKSFVGKSESRNTVQHTKQDTGNKNAQASADNNVFHKKAINVIQT